MNTSYLILIAISIYSFISIVYVYKLRGKTRYTSLSQYLRKSWPIFAPLNCILYMTTRSFARQPVLSADYLKNIAVLRDNWQIIRDEALNLHQSGVLDAIKTPGAVGYYDVGFRTFYKRGWSKFYLSWYGTNHHSALRLCPQTMALLKQVPEVRGAMFSLLPEHSNLTIHADPMASSFRYHLGLATPNSTHCFIDVDTQQCHWHDGKDFVFDETYPHFVQNNTSKPRLILMCDVDRPLNILGRCCNVFYRVLIKGTVVPNTTEDERGIFSALFATLAPLKTITVKLRAEHRNIYKILKWAINSSLLLLLLALLYGFITLVSMLF